jgi:hypothetical protein
MTGFSLEGDQGSYTRTRHPHGGYYAGSFSNETYPTAPGSTRTRVTTTAPHWSDGLS